MRTSVPDWFWPGVAGGIGFAAVLALLHAGGPPGVALLVTGLALVPLLLVARLGREASPSRQTVAAGLAGCAAVSIALGCGGVATGRERLLEWLTRLPALASLAALLLALSLLAFVRMARGRVGGSLGAVAALGSSSLVLSALLACASEEMVAVTAPLALAFAIQWLSVESVNGRAARSSAARTRA